MKTVYFIRHAESEENTGLIQQGASTPLTKNGKLQAEFAAERCKVLGVDLIISSNMIRAVETANIITQKVFKPLEVSELFVERKRPTEVLGKSKDDPEAIRIGNITWDNFHVPDFRHSDEENILVVTHGFFMRVIMAYVLFRDNLTAYECQQCIRIFHIDNIGITTLCHDKSKDPSWWLEVWNDHAHLGEL